MLRCDVTTDWTRATVTSFPALETPRERLLTGFPNEDGYGFCRAVKVGHRLVVSGTTATVPGGGVAPEHAGDSYGQAKEALRRIGEVLECFGMTFGHVIRTTVFFTERDAIADVAKAHGEVFSQIKPASTAVGVSCLFSPEALIEIEAEAIS